MFCPFNAQLIITTYVVYFLRQVKKLGVNKERTHVYVYLHSGAIINGRMVSVCVNYWGVLTLALTVNGGNSTKKFQCFLCCFRFGQWDHSLYSPYQGWIVWNQNWRRSKMRWGLIQPIGSQSHTCMRIQTHCECTDHTLHNILNLVCLLGLCYKTIYHIDTVHQVILVATNCY